MARPLEVVLRGWGLPVFLVMATWLAGHLASCKPKGARCRHDSQPLSSLMKSDQAVVSMLRKVDEYATSPHPEKGAILIGQRVEPMAKQNLHRLKGQRVESRWGAECKKDMEKLFQDRLRSVQRYRRALESRNAERILEALQKQKAIEKEALMLQDRLGRVPVTDAWCEPMKMQQQAGDG